MSVANKQYKEDGYTLEKPIYINKNDPRWADFKDVLKLIISASPHYDPDTRIKSVRQKFRDCYYMKLTSQYDPVIMKDDAGGNCSYTIKKDGVSCRSFDKRAIQGDYKRSSAVDIVEKDLSRLPIWD